MSNALRCDRCGRHTRGDREYGDFRKVTVARGDDEGAGKRVLHLCPADYRLFGEFLSRGASYGPPPAGQADTERDLPGSL